MSSHGASQKGLAEGPLPSPAQELARASCWLAQARPGAPTVISEKSTRGRAESVEARRCLSVACRELLVTPFSVHQGLPYSH